jgi:mono/diheme cytochrome c family protein
VRLALLLLLAGCDWQLHRMQEQPRCETGGTFRGEPCMKPAPEGVVPMEAPPAPPPLTRELVVRGRNRFDTFCAPCHGIEADGNSYIARVMTLRRPPSLVDAAAASLPDDRILTVIARGYGVMPSYGSAVPIRDRYAILHYLRALQQREIPIAQAPPEAKQWLR